MSEVTHSPEIARLYKTAEEARWAVDEMSRSEGLEPNPYSHIWLGAICDEAECYCGIQMPLDENGQPTLTFEEWLDYHDKVQMETLDADEAAYAEEAEVERAIAAEQADE